MLSFNLVRVGAELKFTRGRHVMTGVVKWIGQRPQGSNKTFIGVEAAEEVMDPGKNLQFLMITVLGNRDTYQLRIFHINYEPIRQITFFTKNLKILKYFFHLKYFKFGKFWIPGKS